MYLHKPTAIQNSGECGVEIAILAGAKELGISTGGFAKLGYATEKGQQAVLRERFYLTDTGLNDDYKVTVQNSMGVGLVVYIGDSNPDRAATANLIADNQKARFLLLNNPDDFTAVLALRQFIKESSPSIIHITGDRGSESPSVGVTAKKLLLNVYGCI